MKLKVLEDSLGDLNDLYRHTSKGAWPFSIADHGWPISDCNAEGLKVNSVINIINKEIYFRCLKFCLLRSRILCSFGISKFFPRKVYG
jgi:hypothetical protein